MKEKLITRTMHETKATVLGINLNTLQAEQKEFSVAGKFDDDKKLLQIIVGTNLDAFKSFQPCIIASKEVTENLYGVTETEFLKIAKKLPPRTVQA